MGPKKGKDKSKHAADPSVKIEVKSVEALQAEVIALRAQVEALSKDKEEVFGQLQRVSADYANYQKRVPKQVSDSVAWEKERIIRSVLPVLDNFEHTLAHGETAENVEAVLRGVTIIYDQMLDVLKSHGVEPSGAKGAMFDPSLHEAMMRRSDPEQPDGIVLEEFQKGYRMGDRVLRPSKVIVNKIETAALAKVESGDAPDTEAAEGSPPVDAGDDAVELNESE